jgi:Ser/Thr protein kinase RdoA (MazF antagonist)
MVADRRRVTHLRFVAARALEAYPLTDARLRLVLDEENTTFRVDATAADGIDRFLLRVHRPDRHGRNVDSAAAIGSELDWLTALRADTDLLAPAPVRTCGGRLTTVVAASAGGMPESRVCSVLRWMDGRVHAAAPRPVHLRRLGGAMARLHNHASQWRIPPGFARIRWDWETFFGDTMIYGGLRAADVWELLPDDLRRRFATVAARMRSVMMQLGDSADSVGLIHADLHLGNALFWHGQVKVIDFDDCGFGYWLYDIAVALWELRHRNDYGHFRAALVDGYTQYRPLPSGGLAHLDDFIAAREVAFGLWFTGTAQVNPVFRSRIDQVQQDIARSLDNLVRN